MRIINAKRRTAPVFVWKSYASWMENGWIWSWSCRICFESEGFPTFERAITAGVKHAKTHAPKRRRGGRLVA